MGQTTSLGNLVGNLANPQPQGSGHEKAIFFQAFQVSAPQGAGFPAEAASYWQELSPPGKGKVLQRAILWISGDLTPKSCTILLKAPGWGYQLLWLNRGRTTRSLCQHHYGGGNLGTTEKPGKTRNGAGRRVLLVAGKALGRVTGAPRINLFGICFPITSLPAQHGGAPVHTRAKQSKES